MSVDQLHAYQSFSFATAINTKCSELFSLKRVYVNCMYKNAVLSHKGGSLIRYMGIYFPRNFITTAKHVVVVEAIKYLGKYMTIRVCLILAYEKVAIYM